MEPARRLRLIVTRGLSAGAFLLVDDTARVVGRAADADLVLRDARVSRKHARVTAVDGGARVERLGDAGPILLNGTPVDDAVARVGDGLVLGATALLVAEAAAPGAEQRDAPDSAARTDVRTLMTGIGADVQGLASVVMLVDALDVALDEEAVLEALRAWGKANLSAVDVALPAAAPTDPESAASASAVVERAGPSSGSTALSVPVQVPGLSSLTFTLAIPPARITSAQRRVAVVAGRLVSLALTRLRTIQRTEDERETFRRIAVGSARSFLGDSPAAAEVAKLVPRLATSDAIVLIEGETGVGKTFLARLIHDGGARAKEPLRVINCAAIPDTLIESELFGHERGAFTGAAVARAGALESAGRGTVLLDEIGELPLVSQAKLLRVLEEKRFERLGSNRAVRLEARVLVATNRDLPAMAEAGTFRQDLFYRIAVVKLRVPPLRDRGEDLVLLAERILADLAVSAGRRVDGFSRDALDVVRRYSWPGNVRELRNAIERALVVGDGRLIEPRDLPETVHGTPSLQPSDESLVRLPARIDWLEQRAIQAALRATRGNQKQAAALLGINRNTLHRKTSSGAREGDEGGEGD